MSMSNDHSMTDCSGKLSSAIPSSLYCILSHDSLPSIPPYSPESPYICCYMFLIPKDDLFYGGTHHFIVLGCYFVKRTSPDHLPLCRYGNSSTTYEVLHSTPPASSHSTNARRAYK